MQLGPRACQGADAADCEVGGGGQDTGHSLVAASMHLIAQSFIARTFGHLCTGSFNFLYILSADHKISPTPSPHSLLLFCYPPFRFTLACPLPRGERDRDISFVFAAHFPVAFVAFCVINWFCSGSTRIQQNCQLFLLRSINLLSLYPLLLPLSTLCFFACSLNFVLLTLR